MSNIEEEVRKLVISSRISIENSYDCYFEKLKDGREIIMRTDGNNDDDNYNAGILSSEYWAYKNVLRIIEESKTE